MYNQNSNFSVTSVYGINIQQRKLRLAILLHTVYACPYQFSCFKEHLQSFWHNKNAVCCNLEINFSSLFEY